MVAYWTEVDLFAYTRFCEIVTALVHHDLSLEGDLIKLVVFYEAKALLAAW